MDVVNMKIAYPMNPHHIGIVRTNSAIISCIRNFYREINYECACLTLILKNDIIFLWWYKGGLMIRYVITYFIFAELL